MRPVLFYVCAILISSAGFSTASDAQTVPAVAPLPHSVAPATSAPVDPDTKARMNAMVTNNPYGPKLEDMAKKLYSSLNKDEVQRLIVLRNGFGMVRTVQVVKNEIGGTVKLCGEKNPGIKTGIDVHFEAWQNKVLPVAAAQEKRMQAALNNDNFTHPEDVRAFLDQLDKTANYAEQQSDAAAPRVSSMQACRDLEDSMDKNGGQIADAVQKITWPGEHPSSPAPAGSK